MPDPSSRRKLAAILSADMVGYSRLMAADETATVETLKSCRDIIARSSCAAVAAWSTPPATHCWPSSPVRSRRFRLPSRSRNP
jgi:hypothetical protein